MKILMRILISIGVVATVFSSIEAAYSQVSGLRGKFDGTQTQEARIREVGSLAVAVEINDGRTWQQWYATRRGDTNFSRIISCTVGDFNADKKSDIACLYDYGNFDVGMWVLTSDGRNFNSSIWWRSGQGNLNPNSVVGRIESIDNNNDGLSDLKMPYLYPNGIRQDIVFYSDGNKFYR